MVTITTACEHRTIENECHILVLLLFVHYINLRQHTALQQFGTNHEKSEIDIIVDDGGVLFLQLGQL